MKKSWFSKILLHKCYLNENFILQLSFSQCFEKNIEALLPALNSHSPAPLKQGINRLRLT